MTNIYYRVAHSETKQGLWYNYQGEFTGLIHDKFNFCTNSHLEMPKDPLIVGWLSATQTLDELFQWFPKEDIKQLQDHGYYIMAYEAEKVKQYKNHLVICQKTSKFLQQIPIELILNSN